MTQHTPGPWEAREVPSFRYVIVAQEGRMHGHCIVAPPLEREAAGLAQEDRANARLIAAAPDLLRLLDALIPLAESRAEDLNETVREMEEDDSVWERAAIVEAAEQRDDAWKHVEEARALRARICQPQDATTPA